MQSVVLDATTKKLVSGQVTVCSVEICVNQKSANVLVCKVDCLNQDLLVCE